MHYITYNIKLLQLVYVSDCTYLQCESTLMFQRFEFLEYCAY